MNGQFHTYEYVDLLYDSTQEFYGSICNGIGFLFNPNQRFAGQIDPKHEKTFIFLANLHRSL